MQVLEVDAGRVAVVFDRAGPRYTMLWCAGARAVDAPVLALGEPPGCGATVLAPGDADGPLAAGLRRLGWSDDAEGRWRCPAHA